MYNQDHPKYKKVEEKLKAYKFHYSHLNPDSVDLVDKLLNEYEKMFKKFQELKHQKPKSQPKTADLQHQLDLLTEINHGLKNQNQSLRANTNQIAIEEQIKSLQSKLNRCQLTYEQQLDTVQDKLQLSQKMTKDLQLDKKTLQEENQKLKKFLASNQQENDHSTIELTALLEKKKKQIQMLEEQNTKHRMQISKLQSMYEQEKQSNSQNDSQKMRKSNTLIQVLREQITQLESKVSSTERILQQQRRINRELKDTNFKLNQQINTLKCQEDYAKSSFSLENNAKSKLESMYSETKNQLSETVEERDQLKFMSEESNKEIERQNQKIKELLAKINNYKANESQLGEQLNVLNNNFLQKVRELRESENVKMGLERKIKQLQAQSIEVQEKSVNKYGKVQPSIEQEYNKKLTIFEKQLQMKRNQLKVMHENQHKILMEKTKIQAQLQKFHNIINQGNKQLEIMQNQKETLMKENKELKNIIDSSQTEGYTKNSEIHRHKETIQSFQVMIQDLRVAIRNEQNTNKVYAQKISELEKKIQSEHENNKQLHQDNRQLKMMVESVTKTKDQLFHKYKAVSDEKAVTDNKKIQQIKDYNQLQGDKNKLATELQQKTMSLLTLNNSYDELQNILDDKTIQNENLKLRIVQVEKELHAYGKGLGQRQMNIQGMSNTIKNQENAIEKMEREYKRACSELNDCHHELNNKNTQIQSLKNEIKLIVLNNKEVQKEAEKYKAMTQDNDKRIKDRLAELDEQRQLATTYKIENQNLMEELKIQKEQNRKLQNYMNEVADENNNIYNNLTQRDMQLKELNEAYHQAQYKEQQYLQEIKYYEKQLRQLSDDMERKDQEIRRLAQDRDIYRAEVACSRKSSTVDMKYHLQQRLQSLQNDYELKKRQCQRLRMELREYERVIEEERQRNFYLEQRVEESRATEVQQSPIRRFTKSRVQSENLNNFNRNMMEIDESMELRECKKMGESFESEASVESKVIAQKLKKIDNEFLATISAYHKSKE